MNVEGGQKMEIGLEGFCLGLKTEALAISSRAEENSKIFQ